MISNIDIEDMTDAQDEAPERIWAQPEHSDEPHYGGFWTKAKVAPAVEYIRADLARPSQAGDERVARLVWAAKAVADGSLDTFRARNGKLMGIEADDGEKCEIVHSDLMHWLRAALAAAPQPMGCGLPCGYDCNGACFDAAAPQPAPMDCKALVEVIREARHKWICDDADGVGDDQDLTIANALLARGLRLPGDETMAWAVLGEDGKMVAINYDRMTAQHLCNPGERIERVAIRVVEGGDDAA